MSLRNITLVGASGKLGGHVLAALLAEPSFSVTVVVRKSSKANFPSSVTVKLVSDGFTTEELIPVLQGQDAVITTVQGTNSALQIRIANAAVKAGVKRFIPADFGSFDSNSPWALGIMPLYLEKENVRSHLKQLSETSSNTGGSFSWTSLVSGHFFDYLESGLLQCFPDRHHARIFDGGDIKWSATTLETIGKATVAVLLRPDETRNRRLFIESFLISQNELLQVLEKVTGRKWEVEHLDSQKFIEETKAKAEKDPKDHRASEDLVGVVGIVEGNWEEKKDFANELLGVEKEDLEAVVRKLLGK
jgi:nucleoside-diphosphate-sugar epimerase